MTNAVTLASLANSGYLRNRVINGSMEVWQRGTSFSGSGLNTYAADRWIVARTGTGTTTVTQLASSAYGGRYALNYSGNYGPGEIQDFKQRIESVNSYDLVGNQVTLSFYHAESTTAGTMTLDVLLTYPTAVDNFSSVVTIESKSIQLTSTPTKLSLVFNALPAQVANGLEIIFRYSLSGSVATLQGAIGSVQLEKGTQATPFEWRQYTTELNLCQRYYVGANTYYFTVGYDSAYTTYNSGGLAWSYQMRTTPTMGIISGGMDGHHSVAPTVRTGPVYYGVSLLYSGSGLRTNANCPAYVSFWLSAEL